MSDGIVTPYSFGEDYIRNKEKERMANIMYNQKKAAIQPAQVERAKELATKYPTAMKGLISNAVNKGLSDKQVEELLRLQYQAVPKSKPYNPNPLGNDITNAYINNPVYGTLYNVPGSKYTLPSEGKPFASGSYRKEPVYGTLKGISRAAILAFEGLWNVTVGRGGRAFVETAESYERPFQAVVQGLSKKEQKLIEQHKAGDPDVTLWDIAAIRDQKAKTESTGRIAGAALALSGLLAGRALSHSKQTKKTFKDNWNDAGASFLGTAKAAVEDGQSVSDVWKSMGEGFIPQGPLVAQALKQQEAQKYRGRNITLGRYVEDVIGVDPNSKLYGVVSGPIDFYVALQLDPGLVITKSAKAIKYGKSVMAKLDKAFRNGDFDKIPEIVQSFVDSPKSQKHLEALAQSKDFQAIFKATNDADIAIKLTKTNTVDEVKDVITNYVIKNQSTGIPKITRTVDSIGYNRNLVKALKGKNNPYPKFGEWTPNQDSLFKDVDGGVDNYIRWMTAMKVPAPIANKLAQNFAEASVIGNKSLQRKILYNDTKLQVAEVMKKNGFSDSAIQKFKQTIDEQSGVLPSGETINKSYWAQLENRVGGKFQSPVEATFQGQRTIPVAGGSPVPLPTPFDLGQHMDEVWSLGNPQDITRMMGKMNKWATLPIKETKMYNIINDTVEQLPKGVQTPIQNILGPTVRGADFFKQFAPGAMFDFIDDMLWPYQKLWTGAQLVTRVAWPLRILGESQFRMGLDGLDNWIDNPSTMWAWGNFSYDLAGTPMQKGLGPRSAAYGAGAEKIVARRATAVFDKGRQIEFVNTAWNPVLKNNLTQKQFVDSWQINLKWPLESDLAKSVADEILEGTDLVKTKERFWSGDLKNIRNDLDNVKYDETGRPMNAYTNYEDSNKYVDDYKRWIMDLTKGDEDLLLMIRDRRVITPDGDIIPLDNIDRFTVSNQNSIKEFLNTKYDNAPDVLPTPDWITNTKIKTDLAKGSQYLWYWLGEAPDAALSRIPTYAQYKWTSIGQLMPFADEKALAHFKKLANEGKLPKGVKETFEAAEKAAIKKYGSVSAAVKENPLAKLTIEEIDEASKAFAIEAHNRLLYNLTEKGFYAESMRLIFPFLEPWKEVALNYPRLFAKNPAGLRKIQMATTKGTQNGMLWKDPTVDELFYVAPMTDSQEELFGIELPEDIDLRQSAPLAGANLFTSSYLPGFGPIVQISVKVADSVFPTSNEWQDIEDVLFPYGLGGSSISQQIGGQLPTYLRNAINAVSEGKLDKNQWYDSLADASKILTVSWYKGEIDYDPRTKEGRIQFEKDTVELAKRLAYFNSLAKFYQPSAPREQVAYKLESPEFFDNALVEDIFRTYLPEDLSFGKYDDDYFTSTVITALFAQALDAVEPGEEYLAYQLIASLIGGAPDDYDAIYTAAYMVQGKTTTKGRKLPSTKGEVRWEREWPEYADKYKNIFPYFAPVVEEYDMLDINSFYNQIEDGERQNYTIQQLLERAQETAFRMIFNYRTRPFRERNDADAVAARAEIQAELLQVFPFGLGKRNMATYEGDLSQYEIFLELKEAANDEWLIENSETGKGLNLFFYGDENNKGLLDSLEDIKNYEPLIKTTAEGKKIYKDEASLLTYLSNNKKTQVGRDRLLKWGQQISEQYPEFGALFKEKLLGYVELKIAEETD